MQLDNHPAVESTLLVQENSLETKVAIFCASLSNKELSSAIEYMQKHLQGRGSDSIRKEAPTYVGRTQPNRKVDNRINLIEYSENSIVLTGQGTYEHRETLKEMNGKWNRNLKDAKTGTVFSGWVFSKKHRTQIEDFIKSVTE